MRPRTAKFGNAVPKCAFCKGLQERLPERDHTYPGKMCQFAFKKMFKGCNHIGTIYNSQFVSVQDALWLQGMRYRCSPLLAPLHLDHDGPRSLACVRTRHFAKDFAIFFLTNGRLESMNCQISRNSVESSWPNVSKKNRGEDANFSRSANIAWWDNIVVRPVTTIRCPDASML